MFEAAKQSFVGFLGPLFEPWTWFSDTIVQPCRKFCFQSTSATLKLQGKRNPDDPTTYLEHMLSCTAWYRYNANLLIYPNSGPTLGGLLHPCCIPVFPGLQLQAKRWGWGFRAVHFLHQHQSCRCAIELQSAAAQGHPPRYSIKDRDQQTHNTYTLTYARAHTHTHINVCIHMHLWSWPLFGPHVVGVFSYWAGNRSEESEQCCHSVDKRRGGPGAWAKESPGLACGPQGPWGAPLNNQVFQQEGLCRSTRMTAVRAQVSVLFAFAFFLQCFLTCKS